ncbi:methyltransferase domain-containing protein [Virgisporangium aurantiacum]
MTTAPGQTAPDRYALDNAREGAAGMLDCLSAILDQSTMELLAPLVPLRARCLELGAGNGSIARWLGDIVGRNGRVVATDIKPELVRADVMSHPRVEVLQHDLRNHPLPTGPFDVVHARLLFAHLGDRDTLLPVVAEVLAPGGVLVIEEWGGAGPGQVLSSPWPETAELYQRYQQALMAMFAAAGNDPTWSTRVHEVMTAAGLGDVRTTVRARSWSGGTAGCQLPIEVSGQVRERLLEHSLDQEDLDVLRAQLTDPRVVLLGNLTWSIVGHKSAG